MTLREKAILAERAARAAGEMLRTHPRAKTRHKAENDFVTEMDLASEQLIRSILLGECPEDGFYGEETGGNENAAGRWVVDPIDGTCNYSKGEPTYTVSIAYEVDGEPVVGCVYCPTTDELWIGVKGEGATLNGEPIHVSDSENPRESFLHIAFNHRVPWANDYIMERLPAISKAYSDLLRFASAAYDLCSIASGRCEGFFELNLHIYDFAAGYVILKEAGGCITGWRHGEDPLKTCHVLATNGKIHEHLRALLLAGDSSILDKYAPL